MPGIDIGCGDDSLNGVFRPWDIVNGDSDATHMAGVEDHSYFTVFASHILEYLDDPVEGVRNWYRILMSGGHLIICVPHRDLYERKKELPSCWNGDHKHFWLPDYGEAPHTRGLKDTILQAIPDANIVCLRVLDEGFYDPGEFGHAGGEYSIETIIQKP